MSTAKNTTSPQRRATKPTATSTVKKSPRPKAPTADIFDLIGKSQNIEEAAVAMRAMSHPLRIKVLCLISSGEMAVQEIVEAVGTTQGNVSQHLAILKASGMIVSRSAGKQTFYRIEDKRIEKLISLTREIFCTD